MVDDAKFFKALGTRVRKLRRRRGYSQEDMISFGFSARHWQQIEAGSPITVRTLLRICSAFKVRMDRVVRGLDRGGTKTEVYFADVCGLDGTYVGRPNEASATWH